MEVKLGRSSAFKCEVIVKEANIIRNIRGKCDKEQSVDKSMREN